MAYRYFSHNGQVLPVDEAKIELGNIEYAYGYGVYENIRLSKNKLYFLDQHIDRLNQSAKIIGLKHDFSIDFIEKAIDQLLAKINVETCNIKMLLIGGRDKNSATLNILCLNPLFVDRKLYKTGVQCITENYERPYPHAKSLNMLPSYLAYKKARAAGAYDALLVNRNGNISEGTRTNFFAIKDKTIYSPPSDEILLGVARDNVISVAKQNGYEVVEKSLPAKELENYEGLFLTSTSSKIMPIKSVDGKSFGIPEPLNELMLLFNLYLKQY